MGGKRISSLNMGIQARKIEALFPDSVLTYSAAQLNWRHTVTPSPLSGSYDLKLIYKKGRHPSVYVVSPQLELHEDCDALPHVYNTKKQWLCLYNKPGNEWNSGLLIADTVIPWACEWLVHYECWLATGDWHGGGTVH